MAYLPFYITPEEFADYQQQQEQNILNAEEVIQWHKYDIEEPFRYFYKCALAAVLIPVAIFLYLIWNEPDVWLFGLIFGGSLFSFFSVGMYFTIALDFRYDYILSEKGLVVKSRRNIPKWMNNILQGVAWVCAIVSILMVFVVGPMAFAGAGGAALLSFGMLKGQPDEPTEVNIAEREDWLFAYYNKKRKVIQFFHKYDRCEYQDVSETLVFRCNDRHYSYLFFKKTDDIETIIDILSDKYNIDCTEVKDHNDIFKAKTGYKFLGIPARSDEYLVSDTAELKDKNKLPPWEYLLNGEWLSEQEFKKSQLEGSKE